MDEARLQEIYGKHALLAGPAAAHVRELVAEILRLREELGAAAETYSSICNELKRLRARVAELEALDGGMQDVIEDLRRANAALEDRNASLERRLAAVRGVTWG